MSDVLVLQAARFGDLVQSRRLILSLQRQYNVHLCVDTSLVPLAARIYPGISIYGLDFHASQGAPGENKLCGQLEIFNNIQFSRIYNCNFSRLTADVCRLFEDKKVLGYRPAHKSSGGILRSPWARLGFRVSSMRSTSPLNLVDFWGWFTYCQKETPLDGMLVNPLAKGRGGGIGIAIAGRNARRSLPPEILTPIAQTVFAIMGKPPIKLFGAQAEKAPAKKLLRLFPPDMTKKTNNLAGATDWESLITEVKGLDIMLTPDTGLMHLAACLGVPVMAFFLSSAWCHETGPYGYGHTVWQTYCPDAPCLENMPCPRNLQCAAPYADTSFLRCLAGVLVGDKDRLKHIPQGMQCWQTGIDALGSVLTSLGGKDELAAQRSAERSLLALWLGLKEFPDYLLKIGSGEREGIVNRLFPESEWMLPRERYC